MRLFVVALVGLAVSALPAAAACKKKDVKGTWELYGQTVYSNAPLWFACTMILNKKGAYKSGSSCELSIGLVVPLNTGKIKAGKECAITGSFDASQDRSFNFTKGLMHIDKNSMAGAGQSDYGAFTYTAIRKD